VEAELIRSRNFESVVESVRMYIPVMQDGRVMRRRRKQGDYHLKNVNAGSLSRLEFWGFIGTVGQSLGDRQEHEWQDCTLILVKLSAPYLWC
jgi:hypothetical protein